MRTTLRWPDLRADATAGVVCAIIILPVALNCGLIAFQPLGPAYISAGILAAFCSIVVVSVFRGLVNRPPLHLNSPKNTYAAIIGALLVQLSALPAVRTVYAGDPGGLAAMLLAAAFLCTTASGLTQLGLGAARLGGLVKFVPLPVVAGFVNGLALKIMVGQLPLLLGLPEARGAGLLEAVGRTNPWAVACGLLAVALTVLAPRATKAVPGALVGLVGGAAAHHLAAASGVADPGGLIGMIPVTQPISPQFAAIGRLLASPAFAAIAGPVVVAGVTLGLITAIQSLLNLAAADALYGTRHNSNREMAEQGLANVALGLLGGMPTGSSSSMTRSIFASDGRTPRANLWHGLAFLVLVLGIGRLLSLIPLSVMGGVVLATTATTMEERTFEQLRKLARHRRDAVARLLLVDLGIVAAVTALVFFSGLLAGLAVGFALCFLAFLVSSTGAAVRWISHGKTTRSLTARPRAADRLLAEHGDRIAIVEIQGPLFFGSAEEVVSRVESAARGCVAVVLDMRRVSDVESTGAMSLKRLDETLAKAGTTLLLSGLDDERRLRSSLAEAGFSRPEAEGRILSTAEEALGRAEDLLLERLGYREEAGAELPLAQHEAAEGLSPTQVALLSEAAERVVFEAGGRILAEGDRDASLYLLVAGRISVRKRLSDRRELRLADYRAGVAFGEMAVLTGLPRTADVVADERAVCLRLSPASIEGLKVKDHALFEALLGNLARTLALRLQTVSNRLREAEK